MGDTSSRIRRGKENVQCSKDCCREDRNILTVMLLLTLQTRQSILPLECGMENVAIRKLRGFSKKRLATLSGTSESPLQDITNS